MQVEPKGVRPNPAAMTLVLSTRINEAVQEGEQKHREAPILPCVKFFVVSHSAEQFLVSLS